MANVTFGTPTNQRFVIGNLVMRLFVVNGASGSTLNTNMSGLVWVDAQVSPQAGGASVITGITYNATTGVVTFTTSGTMVNEVVMALGLKG
jgi:hypothetical protein